MTTSKKSKRTVTPATVTPATVVTPSQALSSMSVKDIQAALVARTAQEIETLSTQRASKVAELAAIDKALAGFGQAPRKRSRKVQAKAEGSVTRVHNDVPLTQVVHQLLSKMPQRQARVRELVEAVKETEFKTSSENLYAMIHTALKDEDLFRKVSRGTYQNV